GCGSKTLVRIGGGNLKSLVVFLVLGLTAFMTLKGLLAVPRVAVLDTVALTLPANQDLPALLSAAPGAKPALQVVLGGAFFLLLALFVFASKPFRSVENVFAGVAIGGVIVAAWYVSGKIGYLAEDPNTLQELFVATNSGKMEALSFVAPYAYTLDLLMMWTDASKTVSFGVAAALGVVCGSFVQALAARTFRWEGFGGVEDVANHLAGAALMGFGGVTALGCTVGQGLSGLSTLAVGSMLAFLAIIAGAVAALKYQAWRMGRML
ncbi:MAG TPA: YeeE/YedE family protein, partial [Paucimonas sp.]|nr:YeeE/YedE family protein [Paucimonas sp.]